ncbi:zinc finger protein [Ciona intestinalis]
MNMFENMTEPLQLVKNGKTALIIPLEEVGQWNDILSQWNSNGGEWFQCSFCDKVFVNAQEFNEHCETHGVETTLDDSITVSEVWSEGICDNDNSDVSSLVSEPLVVPQLKKKIAVKKAPRKQPLVKQSRTKRASRKKTLAIKISVNKSPTKNTPTKRVLTEEFPTEDDSTEKVSIKEAPAKRLPVKKATTKKVKKKKNKARKKLKK